MALFNPPKPHFIPAHPPRFYHPEKALLRQTVKIKHLPGGDLMAAGGALRSLAVATSHPDVIVGAGSSGVTAGAERDEVSMLSSWCRG